MSRRHALIVLMAVYLEGAPMLLSQEAGAKLELNQASEVYAALPNDPEGQKLAQVVHFETRPGSYVEGVLESAGAALELYLEAPGGAEQRRLLTDVVSSQSFRFVATRDRYQLRLTSSTKGASGSIKLRRNVPQEEFLERKKTTPNWEPVSPTLKKMLVAEDSEGAVASFWKNRLVEGTPMVEADPEGDPEMRLVTFLWRGALENVLLVGPPASDHVWMRPLGDTDIWFASFRVRRDLRLSYQLAPDIPLIPGNAREQRMALLATAQVDPLNLYPFLPSATDKFDQMSYAALDMAPKQPGYPVQNTDYDLEELFFDSAILKSGRRIWIQSPAGFDPENPDNLLLVLFDGARYSLESPTAGMLTTLQKDGLLPPVVVVYIDSLDPKRRMHELTCNEAFQEAVATEVVPFALAHVGMVHNRDRTVVAGSSLGGLASSCLAIRQPEVFGNFISMSGSYWWSPKTFPAVNLPYMTHVAHSIGSQNIRAVFAAGRFETSRHTDSVGIFEASRRLAAALRDIGYPEVHWFPYEGGHDYAIWRGALTEGLIALFGDTGK
ncbi:MAG: alpha/beta hydrolase-fold protein [Shimia sp.]|uniref:enterochelin esterase domain-containing protein n=1 Tax=Shimia sp. TaxID=1954381 RepID=UPI0025ECBAE1|nr:alpha/beta hydrolase-fold protein [Shimia sp.]MCH2069276.1 alpha/beta hydrolase-fold protein [Shimia sp.]